MNFGFDLDRVLVDYPPLVPPKLINWLYRDHIKKELHYRYPANEMEKTFRKLTHHHFFRPKIEENIAFLREFHKRHPHDKFFLITGRYAFLEKQTHKILNRYGLKKYFHEIHINLLDEQPHLFKEKVVKKFKIDTMVDDNLDLLIHLKRSNPRLLCFWFNPEKITAQADEIVSITTLPEIENFLPQSKPAKSR